MQVCASLANKTRELSVYHNENRADGRTDASHMPILKSDDREPVQLRSPIRVSVANNILDCLVRKPEILINGHRVLDLQQHDWQRNDQTASEKNSQGISYKDQDIDTRSDESDNDLSSDLVKAALETGEEAFDSQKWQEAETLLHEALRVLQQLPKQQQRPFDIFILHHKLAVCAYYTQKCRRSPYKPSSAVSELRRATCLHI